MAEKMDRSGEDNRALQHWLVTCLHQRFIPLKRRYTALLNHQISLLKNYLHAPQLTQTEQRELMNWINQLTRITNSYALVYAEFDAKPQQKNAVAEQVGQQGENLWLLFGAASREEIGSNIDQACEKLSQRIAQSQYIVDDITAGTSLETYLAQRQHNKSRKRHFIDDPKDEAKT